MLFFGFIGAIVGLVAGLWINGLIGHTHLLVPLLLLIGWPLMGAYFMIVWVKDIKKDITGK